ncbi:hypothetical protein I8H83_02250 [Candidatus Saccharibacteria bacterium]|nr:hypothetical protein [Candidatus Saccharibacteria bacterium]
MHKLPRFDFHAFQPTSTQSKGFILPSLIVISLVLLSIGMIAMQYISSSTATIQESHYTAVAKSAADAGISQALSCIKSGAMDWTNATKLAPNTNCTGSLTPATGRNEFLSEGANGIWKSTFRVDQLVQNETGTVVTSTGYVNFYYAGSATPSKTYTQSRKATIPTTNINDTRPIASGTAVTKVTAGSGFTCAIANQLLYCSGSRNQNQLNTGVSASNVLTPTLISTGGLSGKRITDVRAGYFNSCAVTEGKQYCWGRGDMGQLGNNNTTTYQNSIEPVFVPGMSGYIQKASPGTSGTFATQFGCTLNQIKIFCTGGNDYGQLGRPVVVCNLWIFGNCVGGWRIEDKAFFTTGWPANVNAGSTENRRVFGYDTSNESSEVQMFVNQSQLFNTRPTDVDNGAYYACTLVNARVFCWGDRYIIATILGNEQNGNTTSTRGWRNDGSSIKATNFSAGESTSCFVANGELYCWGARPGNGGDYGVASTMNVYKTSNGPGSALYGVNVEGTDTIADHIYCAYGDGDAYCWGDGTYNTVSPIQLTFGTASTDAITDVAAGFFHGCVVANGSQFCEGTNTSGALGNGTTTSSPTKSSNIGLSSGEAATSIASGKSHSCAIANGYIYCWGLNDRGQLGVGDIVRRPQPYGIVNVTKPKAASQVATGDQHSCGVIGGAAYCWGDNYYGQLGNGQQGNYSNTPVAVQGLGNRKVTSIDAGAYHTCAIADAQAFCWGRNNVGQLGTGASTANQVTAQAVSGLGGDIPTKITTGDQFTCAIANAYAYCWGANDRGQLGAGNVTSRTTAQRIPFELQNGWTDIDAGGEFACGAVNNVTKCWGRNDVGQLGRNYTTPIATPNTANYTPANVISTLSGQTVSWKATTTITAGTNHACAIANGDTHCWGANASGQLGIGTTSASVADSRLITKVAGYLDTNHAYKISAGDASTCAIANGKIACWGKGDQGQFGDTTISASRNTANAWAREYIRQQRTLDLTNITVL